jgi:hypothetical protein
MKILRVQLKREGKSFQHHIAITTPGPAVKMMAHGPPHPLRWVLPIILVAITTTAVYLFQHTQSSDDAFFDALVRSQPAYEPVPESDWQYCDIDDIVHGTWESNRDFEDYTSIFDAFKLKVSNLLRRSKLATPITAP